MCFLFAVASSVLKRAPHTLNKETLKVTGVMPAPPPPAVPDDEVDANRLLAKRLPIDTVKEQLQEYFEKATPIQIVRMTPGKKPTVALLDLVEPPGQLFALFFGICTGPILVAFCF